MSSPLGARIGGIDAPLPPGEAVRWEGRPAWRPLFWRAFHGRDVAIYFGLLAAYQTGAALVGAKTWQAAISAMILLVLLALFSVGCSALLAWMSVRSTVYAITDRRLVMKVGIVIPSVINIPFRIVESVATKPLSGTYGDLVVQLAGTDRIAFLQLYPHARPWHITRPEPALRAVPEMAHVGRILQQALADANEQGTFSQDTPSPEATPGKQSARGMNLGAVSPSAAGLGVQR